MSENPFLCIMCCCFSKRLTLTCLFFFPRCEIVGGEERIDPVRERYYGDQFIINLGSEHWKDHERGYDELTGWHTDNDWWVRGFDTDCDT